MENDRPVLTLEGARKRIAQLLELERAVHAWARCHRGCWTHPPMYSPVPSGPPTNVSVAELHKAERVLLELVPAAEISRDVSRTSPVGSAARPASAGSPDGRQPGGVL